MGSPVPPRPSSPVEVEPQSIFRRLFGTPPTMTAGIVAVIGVLATVGVDVRVGLVLIVGSLTVLGAIAAPTLLAAFDWQAATIELPTTALLLGSTSTVTYRRRWRRPRPIAGFAIECTVVCEERTVNRDSSGTEVETTTVFEQSFTGRGSGTEGGLAGTVEVRIPVAAGAPTFELPSNSVRWWLETTVEGAGLPADRQRFPITVAARVDPEIRNRIGDR